ncbi:nicotinate phosphoribosyltransferase [Desulfonatronovibrio hydrogenovorans]|uniref:nicotinate phosphoribosyltransferase n=1 Tax=Desulfonatronovibrio hydrogenovorans TaxID=53245 RepID=UPI00048BFE16|nr:nicotinate phosphoribosyltransferase [Desulfonatronovibrio hydrogenovorans]
MNQEQKKIATGILYTDQYQLTMAQFYFQMGLHKNEVQFEYFFRKYPDYGSHKAGYCIFAGLEWLLDWMGDVKFRDLELDLLKNQKSSSGKPFYDPSFLAWLKDNGSFDQISIRSMSEGRVIHPNVPVAVVQGPFAMAQILESSLLNHLNYQSLVATRASRIRQAGRNRVVLEFGMRRGQDLGANAGARGALIGGADFTSNVGISHVLGFPPKGTHAHSMIQAFMALGYSELDAFRAFAQVYPDDCVLLVDTLNTLESGVPNAIKVFEELKKKGHEPRGVRIDSGDLAHLSVLARKMLDANGFSKTFITLSNQLDEMVITQIINQIIEEAPSYGVDPDHVVNRLVFGVGTRMLTSSGQCALDGVYKLTAIKKNQVWKPAIKISETPAKTINPGFKKNWRIYDQRGKATVDLICLDHERPDQEESIFLHHPVEAQTYRSLNRSGISRIECLLKEVFLKGRPCREHPSIDRIRKIRDADLNHLDPGVKRLINPHIYHVSLSRELWNLKQAMVRSRQKTHENHQV